jgi:hypothetical protein
MTRLYLSGAAVAILTVLVSATWFAGKPAIAEGHAKLKRSATWNPNCFWNGARVTCNDAQFASAFGSAPQTWALGASDRPFRIYDGAHNHVTDMSNVRLELYCGIGDCTFANVLYDLNNNVQDNQGLLASIVLQIQYPAAHRRVFLGDLGRPATGSPPYGRTCGSEPGNQTSGSLPSGLGRPTAITLEIIMPQYEGHC